MGRFVAALLLILAAAAAPAFAQSEWDNVARVVVMGDLHGDYAKFEDQLTQAGLIDAHGAWAGGATHLVQLGDVPDRAPDTRMIMDHLMRLEREAQRAGGYVHVLIGNHEAMNMEEDNRYTVPGEYAAFADRNSPARRDAFYAQTLLYLRAHPQAGGLPSFDAVFRAQWDAQHPLGWIEHQNAWSRTGPYGRWVLTHDAVIRIGDTLYVHGGISPEFAIYDIATLNDAVHAALRHEPERQGGPHDILWNEQGPLWYRGLALNDEATEAANVQALLAHFHVRHIVVGHTKRASTVLPRFDGAVILTDIMPPRGAPEPHAFLIREGDSFFTMHRGHRVPLRMSGAALCAYLADIVALDPPGSPVVPQSGVCGAPAAPAAASNPNGND